MCTNERFPGFKVRSEFTRKQTWFEWKLGNFSLYPAEEDSKIVSPCFDFCEAQWSNIIYPNGETQNNTKGMINLYLSRVSSNVQEHAVKFRLTLKDRNGDDCYECEKECNFSNDNLNCGVTSLISRDILLKEKRENLLPDDCLTIYCEIINYVGVVHGDVISVTKRTEKDHQEPVTNLDGLSKHFSALYANRTLSDVTLKVDGKDFLAHKAILAARSPVFAAMFQHDMEEKLKNVVTLSDVEADVFEDVLWHVYSGKVSNMGEEKALKLYVSADKYALDDLKEECIHILSSSVSLDNLCDIAALADVYDVDELKLSIKRFVFENISTILPTRQWESLSHNRPHLSVIMLQEFILQKQRISDNTSAVLESKSDKSERKEQMNNSSGDDDQCDNSNDNYDEYDLPDDESDDPNDDEWINQNDYKCHYDDYEFDQNEYECDYDDCDYDDYDYE